MEVLKHFTNCWSWPYTSYAVTCYTHETRSQHHKARNSRGKHAEVAAIKHLEDLLAKQKLGSPVIKIYLSNSPCHDCSTKILKFLDTTRSKYRKNLKVELVFSSLYRVRLPSNEENPHYPRCLPDLKDHEAQVKGLKKLHRHGVVLRTFTSQDWLDLVMTLDVDHFDISGRKKKDDLLRSDFNKIMDHNPTSLGRKQNGKAASFSQETSQALKLKTGPVDTNKPVSKQGNASIASSPVTPQLELVVSSPVTSQLEHIVSCPVTSQLEHIVSTPVTSPLERIVSTPVTSPLQRIVSTPVTPQLECIVSSPVTPPLEHIVSSHVILQLESLDLAVKNTFSNSKEKSKDQRDAVVAKCHQTETDRCNDVMTAKDKCHSMVTTKDKSDNDVVTKDKRDDVLVAQFRRDHMGNAKDKYDEGMTVKNKCCDLMAENDKCSDAVVDKDKWDKALRTPDTCTDITTAQDTWDNVNIVRGKHTEAMTAKDTSNAKDDCDDAIVTKDSCDIAAIAKDKCDDSRTSINKSDTTMKDKSHVVMRAGEKSDVITVEDKLSDVSINDKENCDDRMTANDNCSGTESVKGKCKTVATATDKEIEEKCESEGNNGLSTEEKILQMELELMELKLQAVRKQSEMERLTAKAEYSALKHLKLYYEVRQLERDLGVPEQLGVNSLKSTRVPYKVQD